MNDSVNPNETTVSADAATNGEATAQAAASLRKLLRAKMAAVLQTRPRLDQADAAKGRANAYSLKLYKQFTEMPLEPTEDESRVRQYLEDSALCYRNYFAASEAAKEAKEALAEAIYDWYRATVELKEACDRASAHPGLAEDDVYIAAVYMMRNHATVYREAPAAPEDTVAPQLLELTADQLSWMNDLEAKTLSGALLVARAHKVGPMFPAAQSVVAQVARPDVKEPVRPTEEEIQRYLRELELAVEARQNAHWQMDDLLNAPRLEDEVAAAMKLLLDSMVQANEIPQCQTNPLVKLPLSVAGQVTNFGSKCGAPFQEVRSKNWSGLCCVRKPVASNREKRQIDELRKMIRQLAVIMAHYNEASAAHTVAKKVPILSVALTGVAAASTTWAECLEWRAGKDEEQEAVNRKNESRKSKVELLEESVERFLRDKKDAVKELRRYLISLLPPDDRPPCDELRRVLNMAAYMTTPDRDYDRKTGDFPVY